MKALRNLKLIGIALACLAAIGGAGFHFIEGWSWFDGLYMVVVTFTTIGYQEVHPLSHAGQVFNLILIVVGVSLVFLTIGFLTQALLEAELGGAIGEAQNGAPNRKVDRPLYHLRRRPRRKQHGGRVSPETGPVRHCRC